MCVCVLACHAYMYTYICGTEKIVGSRAYRAGNVAPPLLLRLRGPTPYLTLRLPRVGSVSNGLASAEIPI